MMQSLLAAAGRDSGSGDLEEFGKRLFEDLMKALEPVKNIKSLELLPGGVGEDTSPIVEQDGHIGVTRWAVPLLFKHAYQKLINSPENEKEKLTRCVVLCCPDCTTAWNVRKMLLSETTNQKKFDEDLDLARLALQMHPKSSETLAHRRWIVTKLSKIIIERIENLVEQSIDVIEKTPEQDSDHEAEDKGDTVKAGKTPRGPGINPIEDTSPKLNNSSKQSPETSEIVLDENKGGFQGFSANLENESVLKAAVRDLLDMALREFTVCKMAGVKQKCNYNAWAHRSWTISHTIGVCSRNLTTLLKCYDSSERPQVHRCGCILQPVFYAFSNFMKRDQEDLSAFSERNISDISVLNASLHSLLSWTRLVTVSFCKFLFLVPGARKVLNDISDAWLHSLDQNSKLLLMYGSHKALWCHRRNIIVAFRKTFCSRLLETPDLFSSIASNFTLEREVGFCQSFVKLRAGYAENLEHKHCTRHVEFCEKFMK